MTNKVTRINEALKRELNTIINNEIKNPDIPVMLTVTEVEMTNDYKFAKVYISVNVSDKRKEKTLLALRKSKGFIRSEIAKRINLRKTPEFTFHIDKAMEEGQKITDLLNKISKGDINE